MADEQLLIPGINDKELGKLSPPAGATAMPPLEETTIEEDDKLDLPGKVKLRQDYNGISEERLRNQKLCGNLLQYVASRELHVLVDQTTSTKAEVKNSLKHTWQFIAICNYITPNYIVYTCFDITSN